MTEKDDITIDVNDWRLNCRTTGIIIHNNKILLHKSKNASYYALIGGRIKLGEDSARAIKRELEEELGKEIEVTGYIATIENFFKANGTKYHEITFVHKIEFVNEDDKKIETRLQNIEGDSEKEIYYEWINLDDIENESIKPVIIKEILKEKEFPVHKINDDLEIYRLYEKIYNDKEIQKVYKKIEKREVYNENAWAHHNWMHVNNVKNMAELILNQLHCSNNIIESAKIAAILHDTGAVDGKENHSKKSYEFSKKYLQKNNINFENEELVLEAIKNHSDGFDTDNIIQIALIFADKLDIKYTRVTKRGLQIEGMRQMQYIQDILLNINCQSLSVKFICDEAISKKELEEYYFMKKVGKAIKLFSNKLNLEYKVYFNNEEWKEIL